MRAFSPADPDREGKVRNRKGTLAAIRNVDDRAKYPAVIFMRVPPTCSFSLFFGKPATRIFTRK